MEETTVHLSTITETVSESSSIPSETMQESKYLLYSPLTNTKATICKTHHSAQTHILVAEYIWLIVLVFAFISLMWQWFYEKNKISDLYDTSLSVQIGRGCIL